MSTNGSTDGKTTVQRHGVQLAHGVCHECAAHEELHRADVAEQAKQQAIEEAVDHARATGHAVETELLTEPASRLERQPTCGRCGAPTHSTVGEGPSITDETNQPCGCTPTVEVSGE